MDAIDHDAVTIGLLYRDAKTSSDKRVLCLGEAGNRLLNKRASLGHGQWLQWLANHQSLLGFSARVAKMLTEGAHWLNSNWQLADRLEDIYTDPHPSEQDIAKAEEIKRLISCQFRPAVRGTLGRRKNHEWYTPAEYISRARTVLGDIDIDPASAEIAQETVRARQYFDKEQNGLHYPWRGRVWLNPPYAPPLIGKFIGKLLTEWNAGRITACIALTHNYTDTAWFHDAAACADAVCFTHGRVNFYDPDGEVAKPTQGQAFFYFGSEIDVFKETFEPIGLIVRPETSSWTRQKIERGASGA
jgi:hypothetical protein